VIRTARSSRCPRSFETRTERGVPHFHSSGCGGGPICQNDKTRQNRQRLQLLVQNRKRRMGTRGIDIQEVALEAILLQSQIKTETV
jgi:hypothetical protein